jgi:hypothetical protein
MKCCPNYHMLVVISLISKSRCALNILELFVKSLREGRNRGFDSFFRKNYINILLACRTLELILKVGRNLLGLPYSTSRTLREL